MLETMVFSLSIEFKLYHIIYDWIHGAIKKIKKNCKLHQAYSIREFLIVHCSI